MNSKLFFLIFGLAVVILSIITICVAPLINGLDHYTWRGLNCKPVQDKYDWDKKQKATDLTLKADKRVLKKCQRHKGMHDLEYTSLITDLIFGFVCALLGLLHYFDIGNYCEKITGIIGMASGIICFILTIIYVGFSGYIFDKEATDQRLLYSNGALYKWDGSKYVLPYDTDKLVDDPDISKAKYKDLGKKQYNYNSDLYKDKQDSNSKYYNCKADFSLSSFIFSISPIITYDTNKECDYFWNTNDFKNDNDNKYLFDRWLTSIIFSCLIFACDLGLAFFGFMMFKNSGNTSGHVPVK